jgi:hypothetical protein
VERAIVLVGSQKTLPVCVAVMAQVIFSLPTLIPLSAGVPTPLLGVLRPGYAYSGNAAPIYWIPPPSQLLSQPSSPHSRSHQNEIVTTVRCAVMPQLGDSVGEVGLCIIPCILAHMIQIVLDSFLVSHWRNTDAAVAASV